MEEYIEKLISQIRCKKARPYVAEEIRYHIENQMSTVFSLIFIEICIILKILKNAHKYFKILRYEIN